ncbi:MAG: archease [Calditrichaeota bacterium]|nr:MAG: archease [Calditrichota bacterium]
MDSKFPWLKEIDHTGDCGFTLEAGSIKHLFERAALGMMRIITDPSTVSPLAKVSFSIEERDSEALLRKWLSQLNFYHITNDFLFSRFEVKFKNPNEIAASAWGEKINADVHEIYTEIKAVTYHELNIIKTSTGWSARIIFDL